MNSHCMVAPCPRDSSSAAEQQLGQTALGPALSSMSYTRSFFTSILSLLDECSYLTDSKHNNAIVRRRDKSSSYTSRDDSLAILTNLEQVEVLHVRPHFSCSCCTASLVTSCVGNGSDSPRLQQVPGVTCTCQSPLLKTPPTKSPQKKWPPCNRPLI